MRGRHGRLPEFTDAGGNARVGVLRRLNITAPAAGADWSIVVPAGGVWRVLFARAQLTTSGVVAARAVQPTIADPDVELYRGADNDTQAAGLTAIYTLTAVGGVSNPVVGTGAITLPIPSLYLPAGYVFGVNTAARDVGDQWSVVRLLVEELFDCDPQDAAGHHHHRPAIEIDLEGGHAPY